MVEHLVLKLKEFQTLFKQDTKTQHNMCDNVMIIYNTAHKRYKTIDFT